MTQAAPLARTSADFTLSFVLQALVAAKLLTHSQAQDVRAKEAAARARVLKQVGADNDEARYTISPIEVVAAFQVPLAGGRVLDQDHISEVVAAAAGVGYRKIDPLKLDMALATRTVSKPYAQKHVLLPLAWSDAGSLVVAVANPFDRELLENLHRLAGQPIEPVLSAKSDILKAIADIYGFKRTLAQAATDFAPAAGARDPELRAAGLALRHGNKELDASDKPIVRPSTT
jgi:general secretion pathway protein E